MAVFKITQLLSREEIDILREKSPIPLNNEFATISTISNQIVFNGVKITANEENGYLLKIEVATEEEKQSGIRSDSKNVYAAPPPPPNPPKTRPDDPASDPTLPPEIIIMP